MSDEGGAGRRRGLFRRNRAVDDLIERDPLIGEVPDLPPPGEEEMAIWDQTGSNRPRVAKRTADMFAPKESFSDTWSEDAWDDEWKEPAVRRTSIPPAADPTPQKVDEWLESGAEQFDDVTRDSVRKLGVDPGLAAARSIRPGSTWDDTGDVSTSAPRSGDPALQATIERALATPAAAPTQVSSESESRAAGLSKRFGRSRSTVDVSEVGELDETEPVDETVDEPVDEPVDEIVDVTEADLDEADLDAPDDAALDSTEQRWERPVFAPKDPAPVVAAEAGATDLGSDSSREADVRVATLDADNVDADNVDADNVDADNVDADNDDADNDDADSVAVSVARANNSTFDDVATTNDEDLAEEIEMDRARAFAFADRASWMGTGLAAIAALRLAFHVASGMKQGDPAETTIDAFTRLGSGFAGAGVLHGLLLVAAVTLLSLPSLFNRDDLVPRRTGSGLGLVLGAALVGLIGAVIALLTQTSLADALGVSTTLGGTGEIIAAVALSVVALGATMRALRSFDD